MKILIVDDDERNLALLEAILAPHGYEVIACRDGKSAVETAAHEKIDLILLDVIMPGMSGFEAAAIIKKEQEVPIILVTSLNTKEDLVKGLSSGADEFLCKPVQREELLLRVKNILKLKEYQNNLEGIVEQRTSALKEAFGALERLKKEMLFRLLVAAEYRDDATGRHVVRVSRYSRVIAEGMGMDAAFVGLIEHASAMHDIGKIGIPDIVLLKPGRLSPEEYEIIKKHAMIGAGILEGSGFPLITMAYEVALSHHEKWNGRGYPAGQAGEAISLAGRIAAVADVFDALITVRPYKPAFSWEDSVRIIREERGVSFDPAVTDAFLRGLDKIGDILKGDGHLK